MNYKSIGIMLGAAFVLYFLVAQPTETAGLIKDAATGVGDAAGKLAEFVRRLVR